MKKFEARRHILRKEVHCSLVGALGVTLSFLTLAMISENRNFWMEFVVVTSLSLLTVSATWIYSSVKQSKIRKEIAKWAKKFEDQA